MQNEFFSQFRGKLFAFFKVKLEFPRIKVLFERRFSWQRLAQSYNNMQVRLTT